MRTIDDIPVLSGALPVRGHMPEARRDRLAFFRRINEDGADLVALQFFRRVVVANSPALVHEFLVEKARAFEKSPVMRGVIMPLGGEGLFTSRHAIWRKQRKLMAPLFQPAQIARYAADMADCTLRGVETWRDGDVVDLAREITRVTMSIAGRTLFDAETFDAADEIGDALTTALAWADTEIGSPLFQAQIGARALLHRVADRAPEGLRPRLAEAADRLEVPLLLPGERSRKLRAAIRLLDERVQSMIDDRRAAGLSRSDLLSVLLRARDEDGAAMSDRQVRDEILTLFIAGHETTATALAWAVDFLARDPALLARVRAEVDALEGRVPTMSDLARLPLTQRVFKEALRYYPPVYLFGRESIEDTELGGYRIPRRTIVLVSPYALHHHADVWPDPERFDPDRFLPDAEAARPRTAWIPFGAGPRTCIGNHFALMEGQIVLALIVQRAALEPLGPSRPEPMATLRPAGGLPMRVRLRDPKDHPERARPAASAAAS